MKRKRFHWIPLVIAGWLPLAVPGSPASEPPFQEVFDLVRQHLDGAQSASLEQAALQGLLRQYAGRLSLVAAAGAESSAGAAPVVARAAIFEDAFAYLRVGRVEESLPAALGASLKRLGGAQPLKGLLLDLRFASGQDFDAALATADRFLSEAHPQLTVGGRTSASTRKDDAIQVPTAILVNRETTGAAEVLAALLRQNQTGLLIGNPSAGGAWQFREFPLSTGQRLRIATGEIRLGDGRSMPATGLRPDISVSVSLEDERAYLDDAYKVFALQTARAATNHAAGATTNAPRRRVNEAELVRRMKNGLNPDEDAPTVTPGADPVKPWVRDPVVNRGLDLLKALALVRPPEAP